MKRICPKCGSKMNEVYSFENNNMQRFYSCSNCSNESLKNKFTDREIKERFEPDESER